MEGKSNSHKTVLIVAVGALAALLLLLPFLMNSGEKAIPAAEHKSIAVIAKAPKPALLSLHAAAKLGNMTPIVQRLRAGEDVNGVDNNGRTALHLAVENGHQKTAELLLANGADIDAKDKSGQTPLYVAAANGHQEVAAMLIAKGADLSAVDNNGLTPLQVAAKNGHDGTAAFLRSMSQNPATRPAS